MYLNVFKNRNKEIQLSKPPYQISTKSVEGFKRYKEKSIYGHM
jgi:hypothetical protein